MESDTNYYKKVCEHIHIQIEIRKTTFETPHHRNKLSVGDVTVFVPIRIALGIS